MSYIQIIRELGIWKFPIDAYIDDFQDKVYQYYVTTPNPNGLTLPVQIVFGMYSETDYHLARVVGTLGDSMILPLTKDQIRELRKFFIHHRIDVFVLPK